MKLATLPLLVHEVNWTDLYKLTMGNAIWLRYPDAQARYTFINRGKSIFPVGYAQELRAQIEMLSNLRISSETLKWMRQNIAGLSEDWLSWYAQYHFNPDEVRIYQEGGHLSITVEGPWSRTVLWETLLLSLVSNVFNKLTKRVPTLDWSEEAYIRGEALKRIGAKFIEFGTRRAFSPEVHEDALWALMRASGASLLGTSNVALAEKYGLKAIGTFAHEWVMGHAGIYGYEHANLMALETWLEVYKGAYNIALTDTFTTTKFLEIFDRRLAQAFAGVRQDSGDTLLYADQLIAHYQKLDIDPRDKQLIPSDGLDVPRVAQIQEYCEGKIQTSYGIGTELTNNVTGLSSLNIVMKLQAIRMPEAEWVPVVKLSDVPSKVSGDFQAVQKAYAALGIKA